MEQSNKELLLKGLVSLEIESPEEKAEKLALYGDILMETNGKFNLLGKVTENDIVVKHILDSLSGWKYVKDAKSFIDIGTGAGFPGLPLAVCLPNVKATLADATEKKIEFIKGVCGRLGLENVNPIAGRAEELAHGKMRESFDICVSRAVAALNKLSEYCLPFVKCGGMLVAYKGPLVYDEVKEAEHAFGMLGARLEGISIVNVPFLEGERYVAKIKKQKPTNPIYPRKNAQIVKKPL